MGSAGILYWLLPRRIRSSWPLLAITSFGILCAVTLMAVGAIYSQALSEGGLRHTLASTSAHVLNIHVITQNRPMGPADYQKLRTVVEEASQSRMGHLLRGMERYGVMQGAIRMVRPPLEAEPSMDSPIGRPFFLTAFQDHSFLVEGRWPQDSSVNGDQGVALEAVLGARSAKQTGLMVGSRVDLAPFATDTSERIFVTVVGLADASDPNEEYWMNSPAAYFSLQEEGDVLVLPLYITEESFFGGVGTRYPSLVADFTWFLFQDTTLLTSSTVKPTQVGLAGLETDINQQFPRSWVLTGLKPTLKEFQRELMLARVPIFLFISLVVALILYFLALVMGLLARTRADEASLLRSRGASVLQVSGLLVLSEGVVTVLAMIAGPFLALAIVRFLLLSTINPAGEAGSALAVGLSPETFLMGALGGSLSLAVLAGSSVSRARMGLVESLTARSRPPSMPFVQRYYIDLLVLAAVAFLLWEIQGREGFVVWDLSSKALEVDFVLLFGPVLGLIGAAVIVLRLLPWLVRLMAWPGGRLAPAWIAFALARLARDPLPHGSLVIILMMATALGVFGATFQATLALSQTERALYDAGGEVVLTGPSLSGSAEAKLTGQPGVKSFSPILRESAILLDVFPGTPSALLGVDPAALPDTAWFRDDFAGKTLPELLEPLQPISYRSPYSTEDPSRGIPIPGDAQFVGIWIDPSGLDRNGFQTGVSLWARLYDGGGGYHNLLLGDVAPSIFNPSAGASSAASAPGAPVQPGSPWIYLEAPVPDTRALPEEKFQLVSIFFSQQAFNRMPPGKISMDDITVKSRSGPPGGIVVEDYEEPGRWVAMVNEGDVADTLALTPRAARTGRAGLQFVWEESFGDAPRGAIIPPLPFPLPAIGSPGFPIGQVVRVRVGKRLFPVKIRGNAKFFPTLDPPPNPFLILSLDGYRRYAGRASQGPVKSPEEFWVSLENSSNRDQVLTDLRQRFSGSVRIQDRDAQVDIARRNPLAGGGWNGLTILSMAAITVAVLLTLVIDAAVAVQTGRVDLAVAQSLGFSKTQLFQSLALERVLMAAVGLASGGAAGIWLSRWVLEFLDITPTGRPAVPPMILTIHEWLLASVLAGLVAASLLGVLVAAESARRLRVADILRTG